MSNWFPQLVQGQDQAWEALRPAESIRNSGYWFDVKAQLLDCSHLNQTPPQGAGLVITRLCLDYGADSWVRFAGPLLNRLACSDLKPTWPICADIHAIQWKINAHAVLVLSDLKPHEFTQAHLSGGRKAPPSQTSASHLPTSLVVISLSQK